MLSRLVWGDCMQAHDLDVLNLDILRKRHGRSRLFLEDDPPIGVEDDSPRSVEDDSPKSGEDDSPKSGEDDGPMIAMPSVTKRTSMASAVLFVFVVVVG